MEVKSRTVYSFAQQSETTKTKLVYDIPNFAQDWCPSKNNGRKKEEPTTRQLTSSSYRFVGPNRREFTSQISITMEDKGDGQTPRYLVGNTFSPQSQPQVVMVGDWPPRGNAGAGPIGCRRTVSVFIVEDEQRKFHVQKTFYGLFQSGNKVSIVGVTFSASELSLAKSPSTTLRIVVDIELSKTGSAPWLETEILYPVKKVEIPFLRPLAEKAHADVTIECEDKTFPAHKLVLSCVSTVFARMLESSMVESVTKTIKIDDIDASTIERTLDFIYSGVFNAPRDDALVNLLYCAEKYDLQQLKSVCLLHMTSTVDADNAINFTSAAVKCGAKAEAQEKLFDYCKGNFAELSKKPEFKEFVQCHFDTLFTQQ